MSEFLIDYAGCQYQVSVRPLDGGLLEVTMEGRLVQVDACSAEQSVLSFLVEGVNSEVHYSRDGECYTLLINGERHELLARDRRARSAFRSGAGLLSGRQVLAAPMPGRVVRVLVQRGQQVKAGESLVTLEAMKMENQLRSPVAGSVLEVAIDEGQTVAAGQMLVIVG